jgi:hypothetical protein
MNSDNYEFAKSSAPQSVDQYSSYTDKQWNYINDINNGVYANNSGLTQVQFDLTSIYNSGGFTDTGDMYLTIPIVMTASFATSAGAVVALPSLGTSTGGLGTYASVGGCAGISLVSLKSNFQNLIHQIEVQADGKVISDTQPFTNVVQNFRMLSQMSTTDLNTWGPSLGFDGVLDNEKSMALNMTPSGLTNASVTYTNRTGIGLVNNVPYLGSQVGTTSQSSAQGALNAGAVNTAIANRISKFADLSNVPQTSAQSFWGTPTGTQLTFMTSTQLAAEFKPYFTYVGNILVWYDVAILPVKYLCSVMDKLGLVRKLSAVMRIYFNTGSISVPVSNPATNTQYFGAPSNSTFANTCPITINNVQGYGAAASTTTANPASCPSTTAYVCAGCFIARAPSTSIPVGGGSINIGGINIPNHPMPACRAYYSLVKMEPSKALKYVEESRNKLVVYEQFITNQYNNIGSGSSFSQLVQSGIKNPLGLVIIPLISSAQVTTVSGSTGYGFSQYGSPLDTCPATYAPISLTNLQVTLGGQNVLNSTLFYTYENFLEQIALADNLTSSDLGVGAGLISQSWWSNNRVYYVDLKRSRDADKASTRNLNISFTNNSQVSIDLLVFTLYLDKLTVDCETGLIRK